MSALSRLYDDVTSTAATVITVVSGLEGLPGSEAEGVFPIGAEGTIPVEAEGVLNSGSHTMFSDIVPISTPLQLVRYVVSVT